MGAGSVDALWPFQRVPVESTLPAVATGPVTMVTWVTAPAAVTQVLGAWPVSCAGMDSMELPAKVSSDSSFLVRLTLDADGVCSSAPQPVTVQSTGHVTVDAEAQVRVSVMPAGWENAVKVTKVRGSKLRFPISADQQGSSSPHDSVCSAQITFLSVLQAALQTPSVRKTTLVCVGHFMKGMGLPAQVIMEQEAGPGARAAADVSVCRAGQVSADERGLRHHRQVFSGR